MELKMLAMAPAWSKKLSVLCTRLTSKEGFTSTLSSLSSTSAAREARVSLDYSITSRSSELSAASVLANMAVDSAGPPAGFSVSVSCDFAAMLVTFSNLESCSTLSTFPEFLVTTNVISSWRRSGGGGSLSLGCGSTPSPA